MRSELTEYIDHYLLHDPIGNVEGAIAEYDTAKLVEAERQGAVFIAVYNTGRREAVKADSITKPKLAVNGITVVQPEYVDARMKAVVDVFDSIAQSVPATVGARSGAPFRESLEALRELARGSIEGADAR